MVEGAVADGTLVWCLLKMGNLVHGECPRLAETFAAVGALEGFLFGMNVPVVTEMILSAERLAADVTRVGPLVGVSPLVDEQVV